MTEPEEGKTVRLPRPVKRTPTRLTPRGLVAVWTVALIGVQAIALGAVKLSSTSSASVGHLGVGVLPSVSPFPLALSYPSTRTAPVPSAMARATGLTVLVPSLDPVGVAYHEASYREAKALHPLGRCVRNANRTKFDPPERATGPEYMVMSSRGRPHPATSAVDVAMRPGTRVLAPVSGTVVGVKRYHLYGRYLDFRVAIRPFGLNVLRVVLIHLDQVRVRQGSKVTAGITVLAVPRVFPFQSQVNIYVKSNVPHVHLEVKAVGD